MSRWTKPKRRKSRKDAARGQQFMFALHEDEMMPWDIDAESEQPVQPVSNMKSGWTPPPTPASDDPIRF